MSKTIFILIFLLAILKCQAQSKKDSLVFIRLDCIGKIKIKVPEGHDKLNYFSYTEGGIYTVPYADSSSIRVLCGFNADLSIDEESKKPGLFYKKIRVSSYVLTYEDVPKEKVYLFNKAFDLLDKELKDK